jgi:hypothetical protein
LDRAKEQQQGNGGPFYVTDGLITGSWHHPRSMAGPPQSPSAQSTDSSASEYSDVGRSVLSAERSVLSAEESVLSAEGSVLSAEESVLRVLMFPSGVLTLRCRVLIPSDHSTSEH